MNLSEGIYFDSEAPALPIGRHLKYVLRGLPCWLRETVRMIEKEKHTKLLLEKVPDSRPCKLKDSIGKTGELTRSLETTHTGGVKKDQ
jgi:hypothetical protein